VRDKPTKIFLLYHIDTMLGGPYRIGPYRIDQRAGNSAGEMPASEGVRSRVVCSPALTVTDKSFQIGNVPDAPVSL
jgi:hypothetical protein